MRGNESLIADRVPSYYERAELLLKAFDVRMNKCKDTIAYKNLQKISVNLSDNKTYQLAS